MADEKATPPDAPQPDPPTDAAEIDPGADTDADAVDMAEQAMAGADHAAEDLAAAVGDGRNVDLPNFQQVLADVEASGLDLLHDVDLHVKIELGRTSMYVEDVLKLAEGSVVELDKLAGDPVDIYVNERLVGRGEVLVLNDNFCVRVNEIVGDLEAGREGPPEDAGQQQPPQSQTGAEQPVDAAATQATG